MNQKILFLNAIFVLGFPALSSAQSICPTTDHQALLDFMSNQIKLERNATVKGEFDYHDLITNKNIIFERNQEDGMVKYKRLSDDSVKSRVINVIKGQDEGVKPEQWAQRDFTKENYNFTFSSEDNGLFKYAVEPVKDTQGRYKKGSFLWLDPKTCSLAKSQGYVSPGNPLLASLNVTTTFKKINGMDLPSSILLDYKMRFGIKGTGKTEVTVTYAQGDVIPPAALVQSMQVADKQNGQNRSRTGQTGNTAQLGSSR